KIQWLVGSMIVYQPVLSLQVSLEQIEELAYRLDRLADQVRDQHHPRAEVAEVPVERRVVERERALEAEPDRPGRLGLAHFEESQMEHVGNEERLGQPAEEDLHPGLHELPLGPGTRTMKLQEAVHVWCERRRSGDGDPVLTDLAAEPSLFPPDLMA